MRGIKPFLGVLVVNDHWMAALAASQKREAPNRCCVAFLVCEMLNLIGNDRGVAIGAVGY
jgi:hypothetical protein